MVLKTNEAKSAINTNSIGDSTLAFKISKSHNVTISACTTPNNKNNPAFPK